MRKIVNIIFGSHLYGTSTPDSDLDFKSVYIPSASDILLGRARGSISTHRSKSEGEKNFAGEVDEESYSLQKFLMLLAEGQTVALDVLFAPRSSMLGPPSEEWLEIVANRDKMLTKKSKAYVGYCRMQANKYGIKGSRVAAARKALKILNIALSDHYCLTAMSKLKEIEKVLIPLAEETDHIEIVPMEQMGGTVVNHLEVCGRKLSYNATIKHGRDVLDKLVNEYGKRALQAEGQQGVDWKALSHAVRVGTQAIELLRTGNVTFPLANAGHLLDIKLGRLLYKEVSTEIEGLVDLIEIEAIESDLPEEPDMRWIENFIEDCHAAQVKEEYGDRYGDW